MSEQQQKDPSLRGSATDPTTGLQRISPTAGGMLRTPAQKMPKILYKRALKQLSSLPLAIGELLLVAALSAVGTVIDQNQELAFYQEMYPSVGPKVTPITLNPNKSIDDEVFKQELDRSLHLNPETLAGTSSRTTIEK